MRLRRGLELDCIVKLLHQLRKDRLVLVQVLIGLRPVNTRTVPGRGTRVGVLVLAALKGFTFSSQVLHALEIKEFFFLVAAETHCKHLAFESLVAVIFFRC